jgi:PAS domain-containing protein
MAKRTSTSDSADAAAPDAEAQLLRAGLDTLTFGFAIFDDAMKLVASNQAFRTLRGYPSALCKAGTELAEFYLYNAERGDYGPGNADALARTRMNRVRARKPHALEFALASGQTLQVQYSPMGDAGLVLTYSDITARKRAEEAVARKERSSKSLWTTCQAHLCYTNDDLNIVICNDRFADMYPVPRNCWSPGALYRLAAPSGHAWLLRRRRRRGSGRKESGESTQPTGSTFEDRTPRWSHVRESIAVAPHPGHSDGNHRISPGSRWPSPIWPARRRNSISRWTTCRARCPISTKRSISSSAMTASRTSTRCRGKLLQPGRPYVGLLNYLAKNGYYGEGDVEALVDKRMESLRNPTGQAFEDRIPDGRVLRIGRRRIAGGGTVTVMTDITELKDAERACLTRSLRPKRPRGWSLKRSRCSNRWHQIVEISVARKSNRQIFSGEKNVEVASQRKKMTIFFSDIAGFTETTDILESEELTTLLTPIPAGNVVNCARIRRHHRQVHRRRNHAVLTAILKRAARGKMPSPASGWPSRCNNECVTCRPNGASAARSMFSSAHRNQYRLLHRGQLRSDDRVDYTIIGNEVNLAARLQTHSRPGWHPAGARDLFPGQGRRHRRGDRHHHRQGLSEAREHAQVVGLQDESGVNGRIIRQEQEGMLLIIDQKKLSGKAARRRDQGAAGRPRDAS